MLVPITKMIWRGKVGTRDFGAYNVIVPTTSVLATGICHTPKHQSEMMNHGSLSSDEGFARIGQSHFHLRLSRNDIPHIRQVGEGKGWVGMARDGKEWTQDFDFFRWGEFWTDG